MAMAWMARNSDGLVRGRPGGLGIFGLAACVVVGLSGCVATQSSTVAEAPATQAEPDPAAAPDAGLDTLMADQGLFGQDAGRLGAPEAGIARVGLLVPLTDQHAEAGRALLSGAQMALFEIGFDGVELATYDTQGTPEGAREAAADALVDGATMLLGPLLAPNVAAAGELARARSVPMVAFSNSEQVAGNGVYLIGLAPSDQIRRIVSHAAAEGRTRLAVIAPRDAYGDAVLAGAERAAAATGATVVRRLTYAGASTEWTDQIRAFADFDARARALEAERRSLRARGDDGALAALRRLDGLDTLGDPPFDAVLVAATDPVALKSLSGLLAFHDVNLPGVRLLGLELWDSLGRLGDDTSLVGARYPARPRDERASFAERYGALYQTQPGRIASLGYDATALALIARRQEPGTRIAETIVNPFGFLGVDGLFRFDPATGVAERGLDVVEVTPRGAVVVETAPVAFPTPGTPGS